MITYVLKNILNIFKAIDKPLRSGNISLKVDFPNKMNDIDIPPRKQTCTYNDEFNQDKTLMYFRNLQSKLINCLKDNDFEDNKLPLQLLLRITLKYFTSMT